MALPSPISDSARPGFLRLPQWGVRGSLFAAFAVIAGLAILISAGAGIVLGHLGSTMTELSGRDIPRLAVNRGVPLGVITDGRWPTGPADLTSPWTFLMFTDGLFEVRRGAGSERLGVDGLIGCSASSSRSVPQRPPRRVARGGAGDARRSARQRVTLVELRATDRRDRADARRPAAPGSGRCGPRWSRRSSSPG